MSSRLVTITGLGGAGKTRVSVRMAEMLAARFALGAWFVDLSSVTTADGAALAVSGSLGVSADAASAIDVVSATISGGELLLVIDNCEQVIEAVADMVARLLERCRRLTVLATSRERLHVSGELTVPIEPLESPLRTPRPRTR